MSLVYSPISRSSHSNGSTRYSIVLSLLLLCSLRPFHTGLIARLTNWRNFPLPTVSKCLNWRQLPWVLHVSVTTCPSSPGSVFSSFYCKTFSIILMYVNICMQSFSFCPVAHPSTSVWVKFLPNETMSISSFIVSESLFSSEQPSHLPQESSSDKQSNRAVA
jgi:hypothetical protein